MTNNVFVDGIITALQSSGGVSVCFEKLLYALKHSGLDCTYLNYGNNLHINMDKYSNTEKFDIIQRKKFPPLPLERYCKVSATGSGVFHSSYYRLPRNRNRRVVTTVHDFVYEHYISGIASKLHSYQKKNAILNSDVIICVSDNTRRDLLQFIPEAHGKDIRVVYNGVSGAYYPLVGYKKDKQTILFVGSRVSYKQFQTLVDILHYIPGFTLTIVGGGKLTKSEKNLLESKMTDRFIKHDFVNDAKLNELYNNAFCLVYPSTYEGFGIPVLEAMKAGCPVIAMNKSSIPEISGDAALLLDDLNRESLIKALQDLRRDDFRAKLINFGHENVKRFSWKRNTEQILSIYKELL
ncbi:glycosyltransferase family 4 protein [Catenovulum sediminis]|uniref:Glycosyltransferase family 1 protein n=1 Tax=Catenovulum sediminis TaxID=1740262 RepID=A0ABV1RKF4_9ALTE